jgi:hypothetical protein
MNEDRTAELSKDLSDSEKLAFLIEEAMTNREWRAEISARLAKVETFVEERSREIRPILELILKAVADLGQSVKEIRANIRILRDGEWRKKREMVELADRRAALESRPN